jgi:hypothetical protein
MKFSQWAAEKEINECVEIVLKYGMDEGVLNWAGKLAGGAAGLLAGKKAGASAGKMLGKMSGIPFLGSYAGEKLGGITGAAGGGALGWKAGGALGQAADNWIANKAKAGAERVSDAGRSMMGMGSRNTPEFKQAKSSVEQIINSASSLSKSNKGFQSVLQIAQELKKALFQAVNQHSV